MISLLPKNSNPDVQLGLSIRLGQLDLGSKKAVLSLRVEFGLETKLTLKVSQVWTLLDSSLIKLWLVYRYNYIHRICIKIFIICNYTYYKTNY